MRRLSLLGLRTGFRYNAAGRADGDPPSLWLEQMVHGFALLAGLMAAACGQPGGDGPPMAGEAFQRDARLWSVHFVDAEYGWAVGDRGTIWHSRDGGRSWRLQAASTLGEQRPTPGDGPTARQASLHGVSMVDRRQGIAVGTRTEPYSHRSHAIVLLTRDGGRHWYENTRLRLPGLKHVEMFNHQHGWALGDGSALYPSGVFLTGDGGQSFHPVAGPHLVGWLTGDLLGPGYGALAGRRGTTAAIRRGELVPDQVGRFGLRNLRRMTLIGPAAPGRGNPSSPRGEQRSTHAATGGWLVGDGGLVLTTPDGGASWQTPPGPLPDVARHFDFHAVSATGGSSAWLAGSPGSRVFFSHDGGRTWESSPTGCQVPIRDLHFHDARHGWAVGDLGTILMTDDGGRHWRRVQAGGDRAALMAIFSRPRDVPLELLVEQCAEEGYLATVEVVNRRDIESAQARVADSAQRVHEAAVAAGACGADSAWQFPLRQRGLSMPAEQVVRLWDRANDGQGVAALEAHLVRQIRTWRPDVIVTHNASPRGDRPRSHLINQLVLRAVELAADPTAYTTLAAEAGLRPWEVKKVFAALEPDRRGTVELSTGQLAPRMGMSVGEAAAEPYGLLRPEFDVSPPTLPFQLLTSGVSAESGGRRLFDGIHLAPGGGARRQLPPVAPGTADMLRQLATRRRHTEAIISQSAENEQTAVNLLGHVGHMTQGLDDRGAARVLFHLAGQYRRAGHWALAAQMYRTVCDDHPDTTLAAPAAQWLVQYHASAEAAWREQGRQRINVQSAAGMREPTFGEQRQTRTMVRHASALATQTAEARDGPKLADELADRLERTRPELYADPAIRFPLAAADRRRGYPKQSERFYLMQSRRGEDNAWTRSAQGELWIAGERQGESPKPLLPCRRASAKPRLDGRLDEPCWRPAAANLTSLVDDDHGWPTAVRLCHDAEFLYLGIECKKAPDAVYPAQSESDSPRPRDADLDEHDHVAVCLDLDRDCATYYRLCVDHRGWTAEDCWGDATWNPTWFVAQSADDNQWTIEAAIPLDQLTGHFPRAGDIWAIGIQRVVPGVGFQSWTQPAAVEVLPQGFGYLLFE